MKKKEITQEQLNALNFERGRKVDGAKQYRGLVARGLLYYRWGMSNAHGYKITQAGIDALKSAGL